MANIEISGLYITSDQYIADFPSSYYMQNKGETKPNDYAIRDRDGIPG